MLECLNARGWWRFHDKGSLGFIGRDMKLMEILILIGYLMCEDLRLRLLTKDILYPLVTHWTPTSVLPI